MENISFSEASYLLLVIPGFVLIWTFRHFSESTKRIGEFEYAAWSFLWGVVLLAILVISIHFSGKSLPSTPINDVFSLIGSLLGIGIAQATALVIPLGYLGAIFQRMGLFRSIDKFLISLISKSV